MDVDLRAPFPWFGGKSRCAGLVWDRFGNVENYVEPFFGSGAVLLGRSHAPKFETVNDLDCMVANFWRALQHDPDAVAACADWPINEADKHARHLWLCSQEEFRERMKTDPDYYDSKIAGWWVWGLCIWIGGGWCEKEFTAEDAARVSRQLPAMGGGRGVHRQLPAMGTGMGVHRESLDLGGAMNGVPFLVEYMRGLAARLRRVRVACGDWSRVVSYSVTENLGTTAIFLDPPYTEGDMQYAAGGCGTNLPKDVCAWAIENGENPNLRIALCGYEGEHELPASWETVPWKARKGYQSTDKACEDRGRERIWFSPHCLKPQPSLFG
jgi:DNA adenine methylase